MQLKYNFFHFFSSVVNNVRANYRQYRLTTGAISPNMNMTNAGDIKAFFISLYKNLAILGLVQAGPAALAYFTQNLQVTITSEAYENGAVVVTVPNPIGTQLRGIRGVLQLVFQNFGS